MLKINDYLYLFPFEERRDRPNIGVIIGKNFNLLVDFGISENHLNEVINELNELNIAYPKVGVLTHYHYDHSFALPYFKGISIANSNSNKFLKVLKNVPKNETFFKNYLSGEALSFCFNALKEEYEDFSLIKVKESDISFSSYLKIDLGDKFVELFHLPSPHSEDATFIKVNNYLFIGDAFYYDIFNGETFFDKEKLKAFLLIIQNFDIDFIIEGHSEIKTKETLIKEIMSEL